MAINTVVKLVAATAMCATVVVAPVAGGVTADEHGGQLSVEVVASGLDNPRGVAVANGSVYVAESGTGGDSDDCFPDPEGNGDKCYGPTGAITRVFGGEQSRVLDGLPSFAVSDGSAASGPSDVAFENGRLWVANSLGADPAVLDTFDHPETASAGAIVKANRFNRNLREVGDIAEHEATANPDGRAVDTNPVSLAFMGGEIFVADAGGNSLLEVRLNGDVSTVAVFPSQLADAPPFLGLPPGSQIPSEAVPTSVVNGPGGALYVGQLTGFPFPAGGANVWKVVPGEAPELFAEGFTNIIDIAFDRSGRLLVLEIAANSLLGPPGGALWAVDRDGTRTLLLAEPLFFPGGLDVARNGDIYVSNCGVCPGGGELLKLT